MKEKNTEISARIEEVIFILHTNPNKFANALGYSRAQTIYDIVSGKSAPSYDFFKRFIMSGYSVFINLRWLFTGEGNPIIEETYYESDLPIIKGEMTEEQAQAKLKAVKAAKNQNNILHEETNNSTTESFLSIIREQAEEIGRLKEQIRQMTIEKGILLLFRTCFGGRGAVGFPLKAPNLPAGFAAGFLYGLRRSAVGR